MAIDSSGNPADVASGELIDSPWGNATQERVVRIFPTTAARNAWTDPLNGVICFVADIRRHFVRNATVWDSIPFVVAGQAGVTGDASGNGVLWFTRALPATPSVVTLTCLDFANVGCVPFSLTTLGCSVGLRRPADNSPVVGIAVTVGYIAVLL